MISSAKLKNMYVLTTVLYCVCVGRAAAETAVNPLKFYNSLCNMWSL